MCHAFKPPAGPHQHQLFWSLASSTINCCQALHHSPLIVDSTLCHPPCPTYPPLHTESTLGESSDSSCVPTPSTQVEQATPVQTVTLNQPGDSHTQVLASWLILLPHLDPDQYQIPGFSQTRRQARDQDALHICGTELSRDTAHASSISWPEKGSLAKATSPKSGQLFKESLLKS